MFAHRLTFCDVTWLAMSQHSVMFACCARPLIMCVRLCVCVCVCVAVPIVRWRSVRCAAVRRPLSSSLLALWQASRQPLEMQDSVLGKEYAPPCNTPRPPFLYHAPLTFTTCIHTSKGINNNPLNPGTDTLPSSCLNLTLASLQFHPSPAGGGSAYYEAEVLQVLCLFRPTFDF